jgi:hypothetical protein
MTLLAVLFPQARAEVLRLLFANAGRELQSCWSPEPSFSSLTSVKQSGFLCLFACLVGDRFGVEGFGRNHEWTRTDTNSRRLNH